MWRLKTSYKNITTVVHLEFLIENLYMIQYKYKMMLTSDKWLTVGKTLNFLTQVYNMKIQL